MRTPFLWRVRLRNYRSIGRCDVELAPLTFLVGPNGSGKSNFLDALRFVSQSVRQSLDHALRDRGGIKEVRRRSTGHPTHFGIRLDLRLPDGRPAVYGFEIGAVRGGGHVVRNEVCQVANSYYRASDGRLQGASVPAMPPVPEDRLYLVSAASLDEFRPLYDALQGMVFFNPAPDAIRRPQMPDPGDRLQRDGGNLASVYDRIDKKTRRRIEEYLEKIVPGIRGAEVKRGLGIETLEFRQEVKPGGGAWRFKAMSMSDGSLRAFGVLVALFFEGSGKEKSMLVGLEEPEMALHPAAAGVLFDALCEASEKRQVLVTTHSPDLLDRSDVGTEMLRAVLMERGETVVGAISEQGRRALHEQLYTAGELLRLAQIEPDETARGMHAVGLFEDLPLPGNRWNR